MQVAITYLDQESKLTKVILDEVDNVSEAVDALITKYKRTFSSSPFIKHVETDPSFIQSIKHEAKTFEI